MLAQIKQSLWQVQSWSSSRTKRVSPPYLGSPHASTRPFLRSAANARSEPRMCCTSCKRFSKRRLSAPYLPRTRASTTNPCLRELYAAPLVSPRHDAGIATQGCKGLVCRSYEVHALQHVLDITAVPTTTLQLPSVPGDDTSVSQHCCEASARCFELANVHKLVLHHAAVAAIERILGLVQGTSSKAGSWRVCHSLSIPPRLCNSKAPLNSVSTSVPREEDSDVPSGTPSNDVAIHAKRSEGAESGGDARDLLQGCLSQDFQLWIDRKPAFRTWHYTQTNEHTRSSQRQPKIFLRRISNKMASCPKRAMAPRQDLNF